jgi:tetratricopeptide (TPR) repeat protein
MSQGQRFSSDAFFIAMACWQSGDKDAASKWYTAGVRWMERFAPNDDKQRRFRAEASALLGVAGPTSATAKQQPSDAVELYTAILAAYPEAVWACLALGQIHQARGEGAKAQAAFRRAIEVCTGAIGQKGQSWASWASRGGVYAELEEWDKAAGDLEKAAALGSPPYECYKLALARLAAHDPAGYRKACALILEHLAKAEEGDTAMEIAAWGCVVGPQGLANPDALLRYAEKWVAEQPKSFVRLNLLGAALYRAGRLEEAVQRLADAHGVYTPADERRVAITYTRYFLAMAHQGLGHAAEARQWLDKAMPATNRALAPLGKPTAGPAGAATDPARGLPPPWNRRLTLELLRREAVELLNTPTR